MFSSDLLLLLFAILGSAQSQCDYSYSTSNNFVPYAYSRQEINETDPVCCSGYAICKSATLTAPEIYCNAPYSEATSKSDKIYCQGNQACYKSTINSPDSIECHGYKSCLESDIKSVKAVQCSGHQGCYNSTINADISYSWKYEYGSADCQGYLSCSEADITASKVSCSGHYGCNNALIYAGLWSNYIFCAILHPISLYFPA